MPFTQNRSSTIPTGSECSAKKTAVFIFTSWIKRQIGISAFGWRIVKEGSDNSCGFGMKPSLLCENVF